MCFPILDSDSCLLRWGRILSIPHGQRPRGSRLAMLASLPGLGHDPAECRHLILSVPEALDLQDPLPIGSSWPVTGRHLTVSIYFYLRLSLVTPGRALIMEPSTLDLYGFGSVRSLVPF